MSSLSVPWLDAKKYYLHRWGQAVSRVGVDAGFSCPNRGHDRSQPGCSFCSGLANRPPYLAGSQDLIDQIQAGRAFVEKRYQTSLLALYFQSYSSTWAPIADLRRLYDLGLSQGPFCELTVGTRPDCLPQEVVDLLAGYQTEHREVWVEIGLQSRSDRTLSRIKRGHTASDFLQSASRLRRQKLKFTTHLMYGLPGEGHKEFLESLQFALEAGTSGVKLHDLMLVPGSELFQEWRAGHIAPVDVSEYLQTAAAALALIPDDVVVWRVYSDPEDRRGAPVGGARWPKNRFLNALVPLVMKQRQHSGC